MRVNAYLKEKYITKMVRRIKDRMPYINNYKEKTLLIANYFCEKTRKEPTPAEVYDMWRNWFNKDFLYNGKPIYKINKGNLKIRKNIPKTYYKTFESAYMWIKKKVENPNNTKQYFKNKLDTERKHGLKKILSLANPLGLYVVLDEKDLYKNKLGRYQVIKDNKILISGNCDKIVWYLKENKEKIKNG